MATVTPLLKHGKLKLLEKTHAQMLARALENLPGKRVLGSVDTDDLPFSFKASMAYLVAFTALFLGLLSTTVQTNLGATFLSTNKNDNLCEMVSRNVSGVFLADFSGNWQTDKINYNDQKSLFVLEMNGAFVDSKGFSNTMKGFRDSMESFREKSLNRPLWWNIVTLAVWGKTDSNSKMRFWLSTDTTYSFSTPVYVAALSNRDGVCVGSTSTKGLYISGEFNRAISSLSLTIPFEVNRMSAFGNASKFNIATFLRNPPFNLSTIETCPRHGRFVTNAFLQGWSEFRASSGTLNFDVRSTMVAIAFNLNLIDFDTYTYRTTPLLLKMGLIAFQDSWFDSPPMQRVYCLNKSASIWKGRFGSEEMDEQMTYLSSTGQGTQQSLAKFPAVCFVANSKKNNLMTLYYPVMTQLKTVRLPCTFTPDGCNGLSPPPLEMRPCSCPEDTTNTECSRQSMYFAYFYDKNLRTTAVDPPLKDSTWLNLQNDAVVKFAIEKQRDMVKNINQEQNKGDYDIKWANSFNGMFQYSYTIFRNIEDSKRNAALTKNLTKAWDDLTPYSRDISAVIFRSVGIVGANDQLISINRFSVQMSDLIYYNLSHQPKYSYWEPEAGAYLPSIMCQDFFNFSSAFSAMSTPPISLNEEYYRCRNSLLSALVLGVGSSWSATNVLISLAWAIAGILAVRSYKIYLRKSGSSETIVSQRTKVRIGELAQQIKEESLADVVRALLDQNKAQEERILSLESRVAVAATVELKTKESGPVPDPTSEAAVRRFDAIFGDNLVVLGELLSNRLNEEAKLAQDAEKKETHLSLSEIFPHNQHDGTGGAGPGIACSISPLQLQQQPWLASLKGGDDSQPRPLNHEQDSHL